ncbi:tetraspanin8 [Hibiscus trionum]|uniref:Tetraspanin8 n=1 Tax=Hibiscus trionum TaxID=183268 RepID=A0A9W7IYK6_HIBTR|nr:tetraspanin8 [Hibiscus trionum]
MGCFCNCIVGIVNSALLSLGICLIISGAYLHLKSGLDCEKILTAPFLVMGSLLIFVSMIGLMGTACSSSFCMFVYLALLSCLIVGVFFFTSFVLSITNKHVGQTLDNSDKVMESKSPLDFSHWLHNKVYDEQNWMKIKSCFVDTGICSGHDEYTVDANFYLLIHFNKSFPEVVNDSLPTSKTECCKPPDVCGFKKKNDTYWEIPSKGASANSNNEDCHRWSNEVNKLCFDCHACKGGVINDFKKEWRLLALLSMLLLLLLVLVYVLGCCAFGC